MSSNSSSASVTAKADPNDPMSDGKTMHLEVGLGDVANRILSVGDVGRAARIAARFFDGKNADGTSSTRVVTSKRCFVTHTGTIRGVRVSIIATLMGTANIDFVVREARRVVEGPMAIVRFGTCGGLGETKAGTVVVSTEGAVMVRRDPDLVGALLSAGITDEAGAATFLGSSSSSSPSSGGAATAAATAHSLPPPPFTISRPVPADAALSALYIAKMSAGLRDACGGAYHAEGGMNVTADSFFSSQGRTNPYFHDYNGTLLEHIEKRPRGDGADAAAFAPWGTPKCLEMESFHLLDLARSSRREASARIHASCAAVVVWNRHEDKMVAHDHLQEIEAVGGGAALEALVAFEFPTA